MAANVCMPGVQPQVERDQDATNLLGIFPEEVWQIILQHISSPQDYRNICRSSQFLQILMQPFRTRVLFPEVVDTICTHLYSNNYAPIPPDLILTPRLVCQAWKQGVNLYLRDSKQHNQPPANGLNNMYYCNTSIEFLFEKLSTYRILARFKQYIQNTYASTETNPFVCQSVSVGLDPFAESERYFKDFLKLLQPYGHHILHCEIHMESFVPDKMIGVRMLYKLLQAMPNLKTLNIWFYPRSSCSVRSSDWFLEATEIPELPQLECFRAMDMWTPTFSALLSKNNHVRVLGGTERSIQSESVLYTEALPNLEELHLGYSNINDFLRLERATVLGRLSKLVLNLFEIEISWKDLFRVIESGCSENLKDLNISLPKLNSFEEELPQLKLLTVVNLVLNLEELVPLDFILPMKISLRKLIIRAILESDFESSRDLALKYENVVKFYGCGECLMQSNIWIELPKLDSVACYIFASPRDSRELLCTRQKWQHYNNVLKTQTN